MTIKELIQIAKSSPKLGKRILISVPFTYGRLTLKDLKKLLDLQQKVSNDLRLVN